jgi:BASS family bile acid:Na+ symporter
MADNTTSIAVTYFLPFSLAMITFAMGLGLVKQDFLAFVKSPKPVIAGLCGQLLLLPAIAFATAFLFGLRPEFAVGLLLVASCPGGAHSNLMTYFAKGDVALSVSLTAIAGVFCIVTIPAYTYVATQLFTREGAVVTLPVVDTIIQLMLIVIVPLILGMLLRYYLPKHYRIIEKIVKTIAVLLLVVIILGALKNGWENVVKYALEVGLAVIFLNTVSMIAGLVLALKLNIVPKQAVAIMMEIGVQNTTLAFGLAMAVLGSLMIAVPAMVYALWVYVAALIAITVSRLLITD